MTIINRTHRFIFIHVPKTGGTSVKQHLRQFRSHDDVHLSQRNDIEQAPVLNGIRIKKHSPAGEIRKALGAAEFERFFKFCVVRNPFLRTISLFRFLKFNFHAWPGAGVMDDLNTLEEFVAAPMFRTAGPGGIVRPQVSWITDRSGKSCLDLIARIENIEADFCEIKRRIRLPLSGESLGRRNVSKGDANLLASELNSPAVVDAIRTRYASDFEFLGYATDPAAAFDSSASDILV